MKSKIENLLFEVEKQMIIDIETMKRVGSYKVKKEIFENGEEWVSAFP